MMEVTQRADARRNRARILAAADIAFQSGSAATLEHVIREAQIGRMTFFRHFPDRDSLLAALLEQAMDELQAQADQVRGDAEGFSRMIAFMVDRMTLRIGLVDYWVFADPQHLAIRAAMARLGPIFADAIHAARAAGRCRADLTPEDVALFGRMLGAVAHGFLPEDRGKALGRAALILTEGLMARPLQP